MIYDVLLRLEPDPHQRDLARGWAAELADPAWMLGRQWQMGEHAGEDASSPVAVALDARHTPIGAVPGQPDLDPTTVPAQAIVESEPGNWWTTGRRIHIGKTVAAIATAPPHSRQLPDDALLGDLPAPYTAFRGLPDGRALWRHRVDLDLDEAWFGHPGPPRTEPLDLWDPAALSYTAQLPAGDTTLAVHRHGGGNLDWYHADATGPLATGGASTPAPPVTLGRLRYPSAPLPRWWQIEDAQVTIGGQAPDRSAPATLLLIDLIVNHSDDWYTFSVPARAGHIVTLDDVTVTDSFGQSWPLTVPQDWSLFATIGLARNSLVIWATAPAPLVGPVLDDVVIGIDEDANLVWAVEQVVEGTTLHTPDPPPPPDPAPPVSPTSPTFTYRPMSPVPRYWHPYLVDENDPDGPRRFIQGRAADLSGPAPVPMPEPISDLLQDPHAGEHDPVHQLEPAAIPAEGLRIRRSALLGRSTLGHPVLWTQRRRDVLTVPPTTGLKFDVLRDQR